MHGLLDALDQGGVDNFRLDVPDPSGGPGSRVRR